MKTTRTLRILAFSSTCLLPFLAQAQEEDAAQGDGFSMDDFSLEAAPAKPAPVYDSFVEGGIGYNSDDSFRFGRFNGLTDEGAFVNGRFRYLKRGQWDGDDLTYIEARGEDLGLDSRSLEAEGGQQGKYKLFLNYDQVPFNDFRTRTPYRGVNSGSLNLPPGWVSNPQEDFNTATQNLPDLESSLHSVSMETERTRYGGGVSWHIDNHWTARVSGAREEKEGLKPLGVAWGTTGQNAASVIVPQPIDYRTDRVDAEIGYRDKKMQFQLGYQFSQFDNGKNTLRVESPLTYAGWNSASYPDGVAEMQLAPDNQAHTLNLAGGYNFSATTRLTGNLAYSRYQQDDAFLGYTANPLLTVDQALPRRSADAEIDNTIANLEFYSRPTQELDYKVRYRYTDRDNDTPRGLYVYVAGDAEDQQIGGDQQRYRYNTPYSYQEHLVGGDVGYRLQRDTKLSAGYEYRNTDRDYSERTENEEHTGSLGIRHKFGSGLTGSADYARTWRNGSSYDGSSTLFDSYTQTYVASLGDADFINHPELRMYHLADMIRDKASGRLTYAATDALTLGGRVSYNQDDYHNSSLGLTDVDGWGVSLDASYRVSDDLSFSGFYAYDDRTTKQAGWSFEGDSNQLPQSLDPERRWWVDNEYRINTVGVGVNWRIDPKVRLSADYVYADAVTGTDTRAGSALNTGSIPDYDSTTHSFRAKLDYAMSDQTTLGLDYIYERFRSSDWQTDNVAPDTIGRVLSLEATDPDYDNHVILGWARFQF